MTWAAALRILYTQVLFLYHPPLFPRACRLTRQPFGSPFAYRALCAAARNTHFLVYLAVSSPSGFAIAVLVSAFGYWKKNEVILPAYHVACKAAGPAFGEYVVPAAQALTGYDLVKKVLDAFKGAISKA